MKTPRLYFLGAPKIEINDQPAELAVKSVALLAYLAVNRQAVPRKRILGLLWSDSADDAARKNLRNTLWAIRRTLGDATFNADENQIALGAAVWVDVREFETTADLTAKTLLYRAPMLDGLIVPGAEEFEIWLTTERERLAQLNLRALDALVQSHRDKNDWRAMIATAQQALRHDNLQEPMHRALMQAHARRGERAEALRQYDTLRTTLERELGVAPLPETEELRAAILNNAIGSTIALPTIKPARPASTRASIPFIGRTDERKMLDEEFTLASGGNARIALLIGELGIGKSRLWEEWSSQHLQNATILETRCLSSTQALPFAPVIDLLAQPVLREQLLARNSPISAIWLAEVARLAPEIRVARPDVPAPATLPANEERRRLFEAFAQCLLALRAPLILFIDDAHWADHATLGWLDYLIHRLQHHPLLIVTAYRPEDAAAPLAHLISGWGRAGLSRRLSLAHLNAQEAAALVAALGGDPARATRAHAQSAGNPYFLIELCRAAPGNIPPVLNDLLQARIDELPATARQVIQAAAILEPDFDFAILRRTSGRGEEETLSALDALLDANILTEQNQRHNFVHPLVAAIVRDGLSGARRVYLHRRAAETLEAHYTNRSPQIAGQLAAHYAQAIDAPRASRWFELAAENALALASPNEAAEFYRQAISFESTPARQMGLGKALLQLGELPAAQVAFESALREFENQNDRPGAARACLNLAETYYPAGRFSEARAWMEKCLAYLGGGSDPEGHALAHLMLATSRLNANDLAEADLEQAREAIQIAEEHNLPAINVRAHFILGNLLAQKGDYVNAVQAFIQTADLAQKTNDDYQQTLGYNNAAYHSLLLGDGDAARQYVEKGLALAEERALKLPLQYLDSTRGEIALAEQKWDEARTWFTRGIEEAQARGNLEQVANYHANLALAARGHGDLDGALILLEQARQLAAPLNAAHLQIKIDLWLTEVHLERRERTAARQSFTQAQARLKSSQRTKLIEWAERLTQQLSKS